MSTSSPMAGLRPVPGASSGDNAAPSGDATRNLSSLSAANAPQTGPTEDDVREALLTKVKGLQEQVALIAQADPVFGKFAERMNQMIMEYMNLVARKTGKMSGQTQQPRY